MQRREPETDSPQILWDVIEEHLDEAGFCWSQWERALVSPVYSFRELNNRVEARLLSHLDGLLIGERPVIEKTLLPALESSEPGYVFAAAYVLASSELEFAHDCLYSHIEQAAPRSLGAIQRALEVAPACEQTRILPLLRASLPHLQALALDVLSFRRAEVGELGRLLPQLVLQEDPQVREAAVRAVRRLPSRDYRGGLQTVLSSAAAAPAVALEAAAIVGLVSAASLSPWLASPARAAVKTAQLLLAMEGSAQGLRQLLDVDDAVLRPGTLFALGFSGSIPHVDHILHLMRDPSLAPLAGEALTGITGVDLEEAKLTVKAPPASPEEEEEDLLKLAEHVDLSRPPEADLPVPDPDAAVAWWQEHRASFDPTIRYIHGRAFAGERTLVEALAIAPMRRRHALALELAVRSHGQCQIETMAMARDQLRYLPAEWQAVAGASPETTASRAGAR